MSSFICSREAQSIRASEHPHIIIITQKHWHHHIQSVSNITSCQIDMQCVNQLLHLAQGHFYHYQPTSGRLLWLLLSASILDPLSSSSNTDYAPFLFSKIETQPLKIFYFLNEMRRINVDIWCWWIVVNRASLTFFFQSTLLFSLMVHKNPRYPKLLNCQTVIWINEVGIFIRDISVIYLTMWNTCLCIEARNNDRQSTKFQLWETKLWETKLWENKLKNKKAIAKQLLDIKN